MDKRLPFIIQNALIPSRDIKSLKDLLYKELVVLQTSTKDITCAKGSHHCCYHPIYISKEEASILSVNEHKNEDQSKQIMYYQNQTQIPIEQKPYIFLDDGNFFFYANRPLIYRLTYVHDIAAHFHLDSTEKKIDHHPMQKIAIIGATYYMSSPDVEVLPLAIKEFQ
jgi:hypothetical protein